MPIPLHLTLPLTGSILKFQEFLVSGTFIPSADLLARGGLVTVEVIGGGGGGGGGAQHSGRGAGNLVIGFGGSGAGGSVLTRTLVVTGPIAALVGAGGLGGAPALGSTVNMAVKGSAGAPGGTSSFDNINALGGGGGGGGHANVSNGTPEVQPGYGSGGGTHGATGIPGEFFGQMTGGYVAGGYPGGSSSNTGPGAGAGAGGPAFSSADASNIFRLSMGGPGVNGWGVGASGGPFYSEAAQPANSGNGAHGGRGNNKGYDGAAGRVIVYWSE